MPLNLDVWKLLAGLGIFLFGMHLIEDSVKALSGRAFRRIIRVYTDGRLRAIGSGALVTALLQSSSAVSLMVLAFVGAGVMNMQNAIGVIMGSNIGTTLTAWIIATIGFKIKIETLALPFIGLAAVGRGAFCGPADQRPGGVSPLSHHFQPAGGHPLYPFSRVPLPYPHKGVPGSQGHSYRLPQPDAHGNNRCRH